MTHSKNTFISSTFWTERIGPTAAIATLETMKDEKSWEYVNNLGIYLREKLEKIFKSLSLEFEIFGMPALTNFKIKNKNWLTYKTIITQEMLKKDILSSNQIYLSTAHNKKFIDMFIFELEKILIQIVDHDNNSKLSNLLKAQICQSGLRNI